MQQRMSWVGLLVCAALVSGAARATPVTLTPTAQARAQEPRVALIPTPRRATFPTGSLPLARPLHKCWVPPGEPGTLAL